MTTRVRRAELLIEAIEDGKIQTPGQLGTWISYSAALPPRLREYVFQTIEPSIGPNGISYLRSLLPAPATEAHEGVRTCSN